MKVKDLILRLKECPPDNIVVVDGYEGGLSEIKNLRDDVEIALFVHSAWYYGKHDIAIDEDEFKGRKRANATYIQR